MIDKRTSRWAFSPIHSVYRPVRGLFWRRKKKRTRALRNVVDERQFEKVKVFILKRRTVKGKTFSIKIGREFKDGPMGLANHFYPHDALSLAHALWWATDWLIKHGKLSQRQTVLLQCLDEGLGGIDTV